MSSKQQGVAAFNYGRGDPALIVGHTLDGELQELVEDMRGRVDGSGSREGCCCDTVERNWAVFFTEDSFLRCPGPIDGEYWRKLSGWLKRISLKHLGRFTL